VTTETRPSSLRALHDLARAAQGAADASEFLERLCSVVSRTFGFERVAISRYLAETEELEPVAAHGISLDELRHLPKAVRNRTYQHRAVEERRTVYIEDVRKDPAASSRIVAQFGIRSILAVPLMSAGQCLGSLAADHAGVPFTLEPGDLELVETIAALAAVFLEKAILHDEMVGLDNLKSNFIALASHELRTPVAVVSGISATLHLRGDELSQDQLAALRAALYEQSERTRELVDQLLDLSRLEARSIQIQPERVRIRPRIEEIVLLVAQDRAGEVSIDVPSRLEALVDPNALDRVVSNLVVNALRYGDAPITVAAEQRDRHFRVSVEDRGQGVPPEFVPRLFDRFSRSLASAERVHGGAGLGLSIAQSYARAHGGDLLYDNAKPRGARFELVIPSKPVLDS
jgi:signal transduction histidine kinase